MERPGICALLGRTITASMVLTSVSMTPIGVAAQDRNELVLEEILVTAERRESSLQEVAVAVSAFDQAEIVRRQAFNVKDIVNNVPNLVGSNNVGQGTATTVFLRGVGTTESIVTVDTAMGFYIDDVYMARQGVNNLSLYDVERVEVLRGPQGTLYGRNTSAGAINVITTAPQPESAYAGEFSFGEFDRVNAKVMGNIPLIDDTLFFRFNALIQEGDGYSRNTTLDKDVNDTDFWGWRAGIRWLPSDDVEVLFTADRSVSDQNGVYAVDILGVSHPRPPDLFTVESGTDTRNNSETDGMTLTVDWEINEQFQFQSITSARNTYQKWNLDLTDQVNPIFLLYTINDSDQVSQEFKLNGSLLEGRFNFVTGAFYFDEDSYSFIGDHLFGFIYNRRDYDVDVTSLAAFFEGTYEINEKFSLTAGGRYSSDDRELDIFFTGGSQPGFDLVGGTRGWDNATLNALGTPTELDFNKFTPKVGVEYSFTDDISGYLTFTRGFRAGGWSARTSDPTQLLPFEPEIVNSYALGLKATVWEGRARINSEFFFYDYEDLFNSATDPDTGNFTVFTNDAEIKGLEVEGTVRISENLDLFGFIAFQDGEYKGVDPVIAASLGDKLQRLPEFSFKAGFTNTWPLGGRGRIRLTADYGYTEDHFTDPPNTELGRSGDLNLLNAALGWESESQQFSVGLSCRNCSDEEYNTATLAFAGLGFVAVYPGEPRTWLLTFKASTR